jgi:Rod binding domain-containing protein
MSAPFLPPVSASVFSELAAPPPPLSRGAKAAREFEAQLIASLLESLQKTFATLPGKDSAPGADDYSYLGTQALASALSAAGGFGIAALIAKHLGEHEGRG